MNTVLPGSDAKFPVTYDTRKKSASYRYRMPVSVLWSATGQRSVLIWTSVRLSGVYSRARADMLKRDSLNVKSVRKNNDVFPEKRVTVNL